MKKDWFTSWFDTPYYHTLYKSRNDADAQFFIRNITAHLNLPKQSTILDMPCGKGRHATFLNSLGYKVTGNDLSENSITYAKQFENKDLEFNMFDMRAPLTKSYDTIVNLFTSFGYFENDQQDIAILKNFKNALKDNGTLVLDFLNVYKVAKHLVKEESKTIDGITFDLQRELKDGFIQKHIRFTDKQQDFYFTERVKFLDLEKFSYYFNTVGLEIIDVFGDYALNQFDKDTSDRLIIVAK